MELENCDPKSVFLNLTTGQLECIPGTIIPPQGYSQILPEATVKPKNWWVKYALLGVAAYYLLKK